MKIGELLKTTGRSLSFEFFPPKDDTGVTGLSDTCRRLRGYSPTFVSVT